MRDLNLSYCLGTIFILSHIYLINATNATNSLKIINFPTTKINIFNINNKEIKKLSIGEASSRRIKCSWGIFLESIIEVELHVEGKPFVEGEISTGEGGDEVFIF